MKKIRHLPTIICAIMVASCGQNFIYNQIQPTKPKSAVWEGNAGFEPINGTSKVYSGLLKEDDNYYEHQIKPIRTGILLEEVRIKKSPKEEIIIPKNTKAFALNYSVQVGPIQYNELFNPVEWCLVKELPKKPNSEYETYCVFWQNESFSFYKEAGWNSGKMTFNPFIYGPGGYRGLVPKIKEQKVDFPIVVKKQSGIDNYTSSTLWTEIKTNEDGVIKDKENTNTIRWRGGHAEIKVSGSRLKLSYDEQSDAVRVEILEKGADIQ